MVKSICNIIAGRLRDELSHMDVTEELIRAGAGATLTKPDPDWCMVEVVDPQIRWKVGSKYGLTDEGFSVTRMSFADNALESADFQFTFPEDEINWEVGEDEAKIIVDESLPPIPDDCTLDEFHIHQPQIHVHITCDDIRPVKVQNFLVDVTKAANEISRKSLNLRVKPRRRE